MVLYKLNRRICFSFQQVEIKFITLSDKQEIHSQQIGIYVHLRTEMYVAYITLDSNVFALVQRQRFSFVNSQQIGIYICALKCT
jgi:hypothetical protein